MTEKTQSRLKPLFLGSVVAISIAIQGCAPKVLRPAIAKAPPREAQLREAPAVEFFGGKCGESYLTKNRRNPNKISPMATPLLAPLASIAVDFAANAISSSLESWKEGRNAAWHASRAFNLQDAQAYAQGQKKQVCVHVLRAGISGGSEEAAIEVSGTPVFEALIDLDINREASAADRLAAQSIVPGKDQKASDKKPADDTPAYSLVATPYWVEYADTSAPVRGKKVKDVSVLLAISSQTLQPQAGGAETPKTEQSKGVLRLDLGQLKVGHFYKTDLLKMISATTSFESDSSIQLTALVFESEGPSPALDAFIKAWTDNKAGLVDALKQALGIKKEK